MENLEHKIKQKLANAELTDISESTQSSMWANIENGLASTASGTSVSSEIPHMKVVHSRTVPVWVKRAGFGLIPKLAVAGIAFIMVVAVSVFTFHTTNHSPDAVYKSAEETLYPETVSAELPLDNRTPKTDANAEEKSALTPSNVPAESLPVNESVSSSAIQNTTAFAKEKVVESAVVTEPTIDADKKPTAQKDEILVLNTVADSNTVEPKTSVSVDPDLTVADETVVDDLSTEKSEMKERVKDSLVAKKKPVIIQSTEEKVIKKRVQPGKQAKR